MAKVPARKREASQEIRRRLASNVKRFRKARGYTKQQLAELCQLDQNYISKVEQATVNITLAYLEAFATGLGCTAEELLKGCANPCLVNEAAMQKAVRT
jgi:transcriptional regulator with XRE-family HTH domain